MPGNALQAGHGHYKQQATWSRAATRISTRPYLPRRVIRPLVLALPLSSGLPSNKESNKEGLLLLLVLPPAQVSE